MRHIMIFIAFLKNVVWSTLLLHSITTAIDFATANVQDDPAQPMGPTASALLFEDANGLRGDHPNAPLVLPVESAINKGGALAVISDNLDDRKRDGVLQQVFDDRSDIAQYDKGSAVVVGRVDEGHVVDHSSGLYARALDDAEEAAPVPLGDLQNADLVNQPPPAANDPLLPNMKDREGPMLPMEEHGQQPVINDMQGVPAIDKLPGKLVEVSAQEQNIPAYKISPVGGAVQPADVVGEVDEVEAQLVDADRRYRTLLRWFPILEGFQDAAHQYKSSFGTSLALIIVSELGDKTFFIAALMAMRHNALTVFAGAMGALGLMTVLSVVVGLTLPALLNKTYTHYASVFLFFYFGVKLAYESYHMEPNSTMEGLEEVEAELDKKQDAPLPPPSQGKQQRTMTRQGMPLAASHLDNSSNRRTGISAPNNMGTSTTGVSDGDVELSSRPAGNSNILPVQGAATTGASATGTHTTASGGGGEHSSVAGSGAVMVGDGISASQLVAVSRARSDSQVSKRGSGSAALTATASGGVNNCGANGHHILVGDYHNFSSNSDQKTVLSPSTSGNSTTATTGTDCEHSGTECDYKVSAVFDKDEDGGSVVLQLPTKTPVSTTARNVSRTHLKDRIESTLFLIVRGFFSPAFLQAFTLTFVAEWGDRSQVATVVLAASRNPVGVCLGALIGHFSCTGLAVFGGRLLAGRISERVVTLIGSIFFTIFAVIGWIHGE